MWELLDQVRELQQQGPLQMNGRLLMVRCRLLKDGSVTGADRKHQELVIELLLRVLRRQFGQRDLTFQVSDSDILVVLMTRPVAVAVPMIQELIAEIRRRLLGEGEAPRETITIDALTVDENGTLSTTEILKADGTVNRAALGEAAPEERTQDAATLLKSLNPATVLKPGELRYSFTPVWDVRRKAVTTYYLRCHGYKAGFVGEETGYGVLHGGSKSSFVADLDLKVLERAEAELRQYKDGKMPFVLVWPLHARTVEDAARFQRYAEVLSRLAEFIQSRMVVAVHGLKPDWPVSRMQWVVGAARRYCRAVTVHLPLDSELLPVMATCGVSNVSFNLSEQVDDATLVARLRKHRDAASKQGLTAVAHRVPTRGIAIAAVSAGFAFVHGDFIGAGAKPEPAFRYDVIDLVNASADLGMGPVAASIPARNAGTPRAAL
jgi:hypothetical protein